MNKQLESILYTHFNYKQFRPGQKEIIESVLQGEDVLGILPTGSGKSLCYLLPSIILPYPTIVISPLISLMVDQVKETKAFHLKEVVALHSMLTFEERERILQNLHTFKVIYMSPELLQNERMTHLLKRMKVSLFVIDEAHCISQWGYDFRPDYLRLKDVIDDLGNPPVLALSGTITPEIERDILLELDRKKMRVLHYDTERKNIILSVERIEGKIRKDERLHQLISQYHVPTIIYFSSRARAEEVAKELQRLFPEKHIAYYHGELDPTSRLKIQQQFIYDQLDIICATSAFGMGINKPNVRLVIHYHLPSQLESFIQEIGRAGRDGKKSLSILLYERGDEHISLHLIDQEVPTEQEVRTFLNYLYVLARNRQVLSTSATQIATTLQMEEINVRLLLYQAEYFNLIKNSQIIYDLDKWENALTQIVSENEARRKRKRAKLQQMLDYVHEEDCLRTQLYKHFQSSVLKLGDQCCSNCSYNATTILENKEKVKPIQSKNWQKELAYVLGIGELI